MIFVSCSYQTGSRYFLGRVRPTASSQQKATERSHYIQLGERKQLWSHLDTWQDTRGRLPTGYCSPDKEQCQRRFCARSGAEATLWQKIVEQRRQLPQS
ncbi:hypothetical protein M569_10163 [Genlisea aurea]|uniref:Uncharacterized protein n=1 Tax=Genlisea aurea TaxID=192259 RepID=S8DXC4_9LAMI|nr:hypothetical protein M569_10163 [Genlisea aurea]